MESLVQNLKWAVRQVWRSPGFTGAVILTLAFSIGANTAIFSIVNALLLKNLPYPQPDRLGTIYAKITPSQSSDERESVDGERWQLLRENVPSVISAVYAKRVSGVNLQAGSHVQYFHAGRVSARYFDVLGIHPALGRNFLEDEDLPHGAKAAILSYSLWHSVFAEKPNVLGEAVLLKGEPFTVIGVLPQNATTPLNADLYIPLQASTQGEGAAPNFSAIIRLRDGARWDEANAEINRAWARSTSVQDFFRNYPGAQLRYYSVPLQKGETDPVRPEVLALMLAAGLILLIACANLAGLTLVRVLYRRSEFAMRLALGASSWQIQRQLWIENLLLALAGAFAAVVVGFLSLRGLLRMMPEHFLPVADVHLDSHVLGFTLLVSLLTSVLFGMLPALSCRRIDLRSAIASHAVIGTGSVTARQALIAAEVALTIVLLSAAGLLIRTLVHLETLPPGFNPAGVITAQASLDDVRYHDPGAFRKLLDESIADMRKIPGVQNAAVALSLPYQRAAIVVGVVLSDGPQAGKKIAADQLYITPAYFDTLQIPILMGRAFSDADGPESQHVVIVNQTFAHKFFPGENPVGRYLKDQMIVGVVGDTVLTSKLYEGSPPLKDEETIYLPATQVAGPKLAVLHAWFQPSWIVRASRVEGLNAQMQKALAAADPNLPFSGFYSMNDLRATTLAMQRIEVALLAVMASLALLLSGVGIFALVANTVAQRRREIGIRIALGATIGRAMVHIGRSGISASAVGLLVGLLLCAGTLRVMRSVIYGISVYDVPTISIVVVMLFAVTLLATILPSLRVANTDAARTLRED